MPAEIHFHQHNADLSEVNRRLHRIEAILLTLIRKENATMATVKDILQAAKDQDSLIDSVVAAFRSLREELRTKPNIPPEMQRDIDEAFEKITADRQELAAVLTENTPVAVDQVTASGGDAGAGAGAQGVQDVGAQGAQDFRPSNR